jgi:hypothetical protein
MVLLPLLLPLPLPAALTALTVTIAVTLAVPVTLATPIAVAAAFSTPSYYGWLLCVGQMVLDIMYVIVASRVVIVVIIVSPPSPAEEHRIEMCKGRRGHGGNCLGVDTLPLPCCGRVGKASQRMFSWLSS